MTGRKEKRTRLEMTVAAVQLRWGPRALRRGREIRQQQALPHIPTGFPTLDRALAIGGVPRGQITEVLGAPTSGMATLALKVLAQAQTAGEAAVYVDLAHTFDPDYAARCGVRLSHLLLARPRDGREALDLIYTLLTRRAAGCILLDPGTAMPAEALAAAIPASALRRILAALARSPTALLFLTPLGPGPAASEARYPQGLALPHFAAVRLLVARQEWLRRRGQVRGWQAQVTVLKNRLGPSGRRVTIAITFNGTVRGGGP